MPTATPRPWNNSRTEGHAAAMQLTGRITPDNLLTLEAYARYRKEHRGEVIAHRRQRTVDLGQHLSVQFESEWTIRYQIQEMLHLEKIFEETGIRAEIEAYAPLVPDGSNWTATVMLAYPNVEERQRELRRLRGIEDHLYVAVDLQSPWGTPTQQQMPSPMPSTSTSTSTSRVYALADEDLDRERADKTSAVHFVRFQFTTAQVLAIQSGAAVALGCDHPHYLAETPIHALTLASLRTDLR